MPDIHVLAERPSQGQLAVYDAIVIGAGADEGRQRFREVAG